jgi:hypothetical protein
MTRPDHALVQRVEVIREATGLPRDICTLWAARILEHEKNERVVQLKDLAWGLRLQGHHVVFGENAMRGR